MKQTSLAAIIIAVALVSFTIPAAAASFSITAVTPPAAVSCPTTQGCLTTVTIQGQGFNALKGCVITCFGPFVKFGGQPGVITNITDTAITVILPVHAPGTVDVTIVGLFGSETATLPAGFTFLNPASVPALDTFAIALLALTLVAIGLASTRVH